MNHEPIIFLAASGPFVRFGVALDPVAAVEQWQASSPAQIELVSGWLLPSTERVPVLTELADAFSYDILDLWSQVSRREAQRVLARIARAHYGAAWQIREQPAMEKPANLRARPVISPLGRFPSANAAAKALGISRQAAHSNAVRQANGWRFEDERPRKKFAHG